LRETSLLQTEAHEEQSNDVKTFYPKQQPFDGRLSGASYTYEYVKGGVPMAGRIYYLQGEDGLVYRIQFSGPQNRMWELREQMDSIAGSFRPEVG
jgi:hypothetical protein